MLVYLCEADYWRLVPACEQLQSSSHGVFSGEFSSRNATDTIFHVFQNLPLPLPLFWSVHRFHGIRIYQRFVRSRTSCLLVQIIITFCIIPIDSMWASLIFLPRRYTSWISFTKLCHCWSLWFAKNVRWCWFDSTVWKSEHLHAQNRYLNKYVFDNGTKYLRFTQWLVSRLPRLIPPKVITRQFQCNYFWVRRVTSLR
jgi:hypothetical protein